MEPTAIVAAVAAMESNLPKDEQAERRRQKDRERKQTKRLRKSAESVEIHGVCGKKEVFPQTPFPEKNTNPPENPSGFLPPTPKRQRGTRLPEGWQPKQEGVNLAFELGFSMEEGKQEVLKFKDYWCGKAGPNAVKMDWDATWRNWLRRASENRKGKSNGKSNQYANGKTDGRDFYARLAGFQSNGSGQNGEPHRGPEIDLTGETVGRGRT